MNTRRLGTGNETHRRMQIETMAYFRYKKQHDYVATEVRDMDVLSRTDDDRYYECEIKRSKSDLTNDKRKPKHKQYTMPRYHNSTPNFFYYVVTKELVDDAIKHVEEVNPKYGVLLWEPAYYTRNGVMEPNISVVRRPKDLLEKSNRTNGVLLESIIRRMSSAAIISEVKIMKLNEDVKFGERL